MSALTDLFKQFIKYEESTQQTPPPADPPAPPTPPAEPPAPPADPPAPPSPPTPPAPPAPPADKDFEKLYNEQIKLNQQLLARTAVKTEHTVEEEIMFLATGKYPQMGGEV